MLVVGQIGPGSVLALVILVVVAVVVLSSVEIVDAYERAVLYVLGEYRRTLEPGVHVVPPFVSRTERIDTRTHRLELAVEATTDDGTDLTVEVELEARVEEPETFAMGPTGERAGDGRRGFAALEALVRSTVRDAVANHGTEEVLEDRTVVADAFADPVDERGFAVDPTTEYGIEIERADVTDARRAA